MVFDLASYYLPRYSGDARYVGYSDDRLGDAKEAMSEWTLLATQGEIATTGPEIGLRKTDLSEAYAGVDFSQAEIEADARRIQARGGASPSDDTMLDVPVSVYSELAEVCGAPAAVTGFARNQVGPNTELLRQYGELTEVGAASRPGDLLEAYTFEVDETVGYVWADKSVPEVFQVVAVVGAEGCYLEDVAREVALERGPA